MAQEIRHADGAPTGGVERPVTAYQEPELAGYPALRRVSWGAIFAGTVVALVVTLLLSLLGIAIGASTVDPLSERVPTQGLGVGSAIWWIASTMIGVFAGGWVAARLAGSPRRNDSILHGIVTWGLATIVTFLLLTTLVGRLIGGAASVVGEGLAAATRGVAGAVAEAPPGQEGQVLPQPIQEQGAQAIEQMDRAQQQIMAQTRQASEAVATGVTWAALWAFIGILLTGLAGALGGWLGRPRDRHMPGFGTRAAGY